MKYRTTKKAIKENYKNVICLPYCAIQTILYYYEPIAYSTRAEGWSCDYYEVNNSTCISTGYAPTGNIEVPYSVYSKYEDKAQKLLGKYHSYETVKKHMDRLLSQFVEEVLK